MTKIEMSNEEAIKMLKSKMDGNTDTSYEWCECVRLAIKALEQQLCDDCISREDAINAAIDAVDEWDGGCNTTRATMISHVIKGLPSVTPKARWIPVKTRPLTEEEKEHYISIGWSEDSLDFIYNCPLPDDGQEVLITDSHGYVEVDTFYSDDGCYFENNCDDGEVIAWMPLPQPYKVEREDEK